jgi:hypothetical protein
MSASPDREPSTYFEIEQRRLVNPGESKIGAAVSQLPPLPANSPWGSGPGPGTEEPIDRTEDAATGGPNILEVDNG